MNASQTAAPLFFFLRRLIIFSFLCVMHASCAMILIYSYHGTYKNVMTDYIQYKDAQLMTIITTTLVP